MKKGGIPLRHASHSVSPSPKVRHMFVVSVKVFQALGINTNVSSKLLNQVSQYLSVWVFERLNASQLRASAA